MEGHEIPYEDRFADLRPREPEPVERTNQREFPHYFKRIPIDPQTGLTLTHIDIYRVLTMWTVVEPGIQHAIKKMLCAGQRGAKEVLQDLKEAKASLDRQIEIMEEDAATDEAFPDL